MIKRRSDLPLDRDPVSRFLPWLTAFMVFLAAMALAGTLLLGSMVTNWRTGASNALTVQIMPGENNQQTEQTAKTVLSILTETPEIASAIILDDARIMSLLEPWLGGVGLDIELPLPRLIEVETKPGETLDLAALRARLSAAAPGTVIDDHGVWLGKLVRLARTVEAIAIAVLMMIALVTVATVVFAIRTSLAIHHEVIEVLHLTGARDSYIAGQFAQHALNLGLSGGIIGLGLAVPTILGIGFLSTGMAMVPIPNVSLNVAHWALLAGLPIVVAVIAMVTARLTVTRMLAKVL